MGSLEMDVETSLAPERVREALLDRPDPQTIAQAWSKSLANVEQG